MKNDKNNKPRASEEKKETVESLKKQPSEKDATHKGYNEKNPTQPQGAFIADSKSGKKP